LINKSQQGRARQLILSELGERLTPLGFKQRPSQQSFYPRIDGGQWAFHVSFIPHVEDLDLTADVAVRLDAIEDLVNAEDTRMTVAETRSSMTLGGDLGNIAEGRQRRWNLSSLDHISTICDEVADAFRRIGIPFLEAHSSLPAVHRTLASSAPPDILLAPFRGHRYMSTLAASYLLGDLASTEALAIRLENELAAADDFDLQRFRDLRQSLLGAARPGG
jgi:hypothetical protein